MNDEDMIDYMIQLSDILEKLSIADYYTSQLPNQYDKMIILILARLMAANAKHRETFLSLLDEDICVELSVFARRIAMLGVREGSKDHLIKGLVALSYAVAQKDYREILMTISLFHHSAIKLYVDPKKLFMDASQFAPDETGRKLLIDFANRPPEHQGIDKMGFKEVNGPSGLIYQTGNRPIPDGWK